MYLSGEIKTGINALTMLFRFGGYLYLYFSELV